MKNWILLVSALLTGGAAVDLGTLLEQALSEDILPPPSDKCIAANGKTSYSFSFKSTNDVSNWDPMSAPFESSAFLASIRHEEANANRSWGVVFGKGGGINSYIGPLGETVPPQRHAEAPWIDEVWQLVSVDQSQNNVPNNPYYIHQAGTYQRDGVYTEKPFYSPNVAKYCHGHTCGFTGWNQHAHVPTIYSSTALYYTRYTDCGHGVLEVTSGIHNFGDEDTGDTWSYINVPWGGFRASVFSEFYYANKNTPGAQKIDLYGWGATGECPGNCWNLNSFGGYSMWIQGLPLAEDEKIYELPCSDGTKMVTCDGDTYDHIQLIIANDNTARESAGHTAGWGQYTVVLTFENTLNIASNGCQSCNVWFENQNGDRITVKGIIHWVHNLNSMFFWPVETAEYINTVFKKGDVITVYNIDNGIPPQDNLAMAFVHGTDAESGVTANTAGANKWLNRAGRARVGLASGGGRDYTVYTINAFALIKPGRTYYNRQYMITDRYEDMDAHAREFVNEAYSGIYFLDSHRSGRAVRIYGNSFATSFAVVAPGDKACNRDPVCVGRTTPAVGYKPLFYIRCGAQTALSSNPYYFTPEDDVNQYVRSYLCQGQPVSSRPTWKLLGFFVKDSCAALNGAVFKPDLCDVAENVGPTAEPRSTIVAEKRQKSNRVLDQVKKFEAKRKNVGYGGGGGATAAGIGSGSGAGSTGGGTDGSSANGGSVSSGPASPQLRALIGKLNRNGLNVEL